MRAGAAAPSSLVLAKCAGHVQLLVAKGEPLFFQQRDGPWYPTLRLVHRRASCFRDHVWRTDSGAVRFVLAGSNVMCPGFTNEEGDITPELRVDEPVIICAHGKKHAMAVGQVKMANAEIREVNKGICVDNLHFLNDGLWQTLQLD